MVGSNSCKNKLIFYTFIFLEVLFAVRIVERDLVTPYELIEIDSNFVKTHFGFLLDFSWLSSIVFDICDFILGLLILYLFSNSVESSQSTSSARSSAALSKSNRATKHVSSPRMYLK